MTDLLAIDLYTGDRPVDWSAFLAAGPPWFLAVFKLTEGTNYHYSPWAYKQRQPLVRHERYGRDLFDGFYHYLLFHQSGAAQADWAWSHVEAVGGELAGTVPLMIDVERGGQQISNPSRQQIQDVAGACFARYHDLSGRDATCYGGELLRATGARDFGAGRYWVALYAAELHGRGETTAQFLARTGTDLAHLLGWQYASAEGAATGPTGYPREAPGVGRVDISALVLPGGLDAIKALCQRPTATSR